MPNQVAIYLSPDFRMVYELLDVIAYRERIPMSTLMKRVITEWAVEHGDLDPSYVVEKSRDEGVREEVGKKSPCRYRLMTSMTTIVCKAGGSRDGEPKALVDCVGCEEYEHNPVR